MTLSDDDRSTGLNLQDTVEYYLYLVSNKNLIEKNGLRAQIRLYASSLCQDYFWHKDKFTLLHPNAKEDDSSLLLSGRLMFLECMDDEWFVVYILRKISLNFAEIAIIVKDTDGDFLLFEASDHLPKWLNPENAENRVFIYQGDLHLIPTSLKKHPLAVPDALSLLANVSHETRASDDVQRTAFARCNLYPAKLSLHYHNAKVIVPRLVAHILSWKPDLITAATEAFYTRDAISVRPCYKMQTFSPDDSVETVVRFTKTTYAQLLSQSFHPPKIFHPPPRNSPLYKPFDLGMKLACGFEIVYHDKHQRQLAKEVDDIKDYDFSVDPEYASYVSKLKKKSYFGNHMPGSKAFQAHEFRARQAYFQTVVLTRDKSDVEAISNSYADMKHILETHPLTMTDEIPFNTGLVEDSDDWMNVDVDTLEQEWSKSFSENMKEDLHSDDDVDDLDDEDRKAFESFAGMMDKFKTFMDKEGDLEGVTLPGEELDLEDDNAASGGEEMPADREGPLKPSKNDTGPALSFDVNKLMSALQQISKDLDLSISPSLMQKLEKNSDTLDTKAKSPARIEGTRTSTASTTKQKTVQFRIIEGSDSDDEEDEEDTESSDEEGDVELLNYMKAMDQELYPTKAFANFERVQVVKTDDDGSHSHASSPMDWKSFSRDYGQSSNKQDSKDDIDEGFRPIDLDANLLKNAKASIVSQQGLPGPMSTLLTSMSMTSKSCHQ